jgi:hypothetical protein
MRVAVAVVCVSSLALASPEDIRPSPELTVTADAPAARRWGVFAAGTTLFAAGWAADVGVTYGMGHENPGWSLIPVIGPFIQLGDSYRLADPNAIKTGNPSIDQQSSAMVNAGNQAYQSLVYTGLVLDAALQIAGVATAIAGALTHTRPGRARLSAAGRLAITF